MTKVEQQLENLLTSLEFVFEDPRASRSQLANITEDEFQALVQSEFNVAIRTISAEAESDPELDELVQTLIQSQKEMLSISFDPYDGAVLDTIRNSVLAINSCEI